MDLSELNIAISNSCQSGKMGFQNAKIVDFASSESIINYINAAEKRFSLLVFENLELKNADFSSLVPQKDGFSILYSDYYDCNDTYHPLCDYTQGSVRDDFDFGKCLVVNNALAKQAAKCMDSDIRHAGIYDFRLQMSRLGKIVRINNFYTLYNSSDTDFETEHFSYCDPKNRDYQKEAERVFTKYLRQTGAYITPHTEQVDGFDNIVSRYATTASVIIPVKDRPNTIKDAIMSALSQQTDFDFNVIVVDNHSDKATYSAIKSVQDSRLVHIVPEETDLGIGGCWNKGISSAKCGAFAIQLDSDDVYSDSHTLQKIVDTFRREKCGVVIGSYRLTDINMRPLNDIIIDHREYTQENGANNALRVNGFGAPRCYMTELVRRNPFKNFSYGEDYDLCLRLSRQYKVSRIFEVLYLCRRWSGNSDANLTPERITRNNTLKDSFRTEEIMNRFLMERR